MTNLPIKKTKEEINFYKKNGIIFGNILLKIKEKILNKEVKNGLEVEELFVCFCYNQWGTNNVVFPFSYQENTFKDLFKYTICVSINNCIAHGIPSYHSFEKGDTISFDFGVGIRFKNKFLYFDSAFTIVWNKENSCLENSPLEALKTIKEEGGKNRIKDTKDISKIIMDTGINYSLNIVTALAGHGIGYSLHERPYIYNATGNFQADPLIEGIIFCIEPIYVLTPKENETTIAKVYLDENKQSILSSDKNSGTHFETMFLYEDNKLVDLVGITNWK